MKNIFYLAITLLMLTSVRVSAQTNGQIISLPGVAISPHAAWGGGWTTSIYITCTGQANFTVKFWDKNRAPLRVPFKTHSGSSGSVEQVSLSMQSVRVEVITLSSPDSEVSTGWVEIESSTSGFLQIYEVFRSSAQGRPDLEAAIPFIVPQVRSDRIFAYDHRDNSETGFAVVKGPIGSGSPNYDAARAKIACYENGNVIFQGDIPFGSGNVYGAWTLTSIAPATAGKVGYCSVFYLEGVPPLPSMNLIAFKLAPGGSFTTIPIG